jgi:hypothetical protein
MASNRKSGGSWFIGLLALLGPYLLLELVAPTSVSVWARVYIAGAVGGLCFELIRNRWRLEMPLGEPAGGTSAEPSFAPLGPLADIAFLGRMLTGAVAAPTFIAIISVLDASESQQSDLPQYLESLATRPDTLAWGVAAGFAAPAVWTLIEQFIAARGAVGNSRLEIIQKEVGLIQVKAEQALEAAKVAPVAGNGGGTDTVTTRISEVVTMAEATAKAAEPAVTDGSR